MVNPADIERLGLTAGEIVDVVAAAGEAERVARGFRLLAYPTPIGCAAAYYPEANVLIGTGDRSTEYGTPSYKSILVDLRRPGDLTE